MRIALVLPSLAAGGAEHVKVLLANEFVERGYEVDFVLFRAEGALVNDSHPSIRIFDLKARRLRSGLIPLIAYMSENRPDAVVAALWPLTAITAVATRLSRINCTLIITEHTNLSRSAAVRGASDFVNRRLGKLIYGSATAVVAVSQGVKDDLINRTGLASSAVHVIYNPVREMTSTSADTEVARWMSSGGKSLIAVGSLKPAKDYPTMLRALAQVRKKRDVRLLILGEGHLRAELEALVGELGLKDNVLMPGFMPDPYPYLKRADIFVLSSAWEGLPGVLVEALVAGVPIVSTDCPSGPSEILEGGRYGRLVPVGDSAALASALEEELHNQPDREALRRRGGEFTVERAADEYLALLDPGGKILASQ